MERTLVTTAIDRHTPLLSEHFDNIKQFLSSGEALELIPKPKVIRHNDWGALQRKIEDTYGPVHPLYGKCFHASKFVLFFGGGRKHHELKVVRKIKFCDLDATTTHWFVKDKQTGQLFDASREQFSYTGYRMCDYGDDHPFWQTAINGEFGYPHFNSAYKYDEVVPSKSTLALGELYKEKFGTNGGIDWWINEANRNE